jgi:hypothetical protein
VARSGGRETKFISRSARNDQTFSFSFFPRLPPTPPPPPSPPDPLRHRHIPADSGEAPRRRPPPQHPSSFPWPESQPHEKSWPPLQRSRRRKFRSRSRRAAALVPLLAAGRTASRVPLTRLPSLLQPVEEPHNEGGARGARPPRAGACGQVSHGEPAEGRARRRQVTTAGWRLRATTSPSCCRRRRARRRQVTTAGWRLRATTSPSCCRRRRR